MFQKIGNSITMRAGLYILFFLTLITSTALAQDVHFTAQVSKNQVATGEIFEVTFSINTNADGFTPPSFSGFQVAGGPNVSQSMTSINGNTSMSLGYSYDLMPVKVGDFTIGAATVVINGKKYATQPIHIKVVKGAPVRQQSQSQQGQGGGNPNGGSSIGDLDEASSDIGKSVFIRAVLSRPSVYQGDGLMLIYKLYTRLNLEGSQVDKMPDFNGFWNEEIKLTNPNVQWRTEVYNGKEYNVGDLRKVILFPDHAGDISIEPLVMTLVVDQPMPARDIMEQFFGHNIKPVKYQAKSNKVTLHVKPLPDAGKPDGFNGAVGKFTVSSTVDKKELKANEQLTYKVTVKGSGNIKLLSAPTIVFPADFEKYDPKVTDSTITTENGVNGYRTFTYLLIPRHEGNFTLDPVKFSYYNPSTGKYVSLPGESFKIKVNKGLHENSVTTYSDQQDIKSLGKDIRYIKTGSGDLQKGSAPFFGSVGYYLLLLLGPLAFGGAWWYRKWHARYNADVVKVKGRRASKVAAKHLANAKKQLAAGNSKLYYEAVFRGLYGYLSDKLNIPVSELTKENIAAGLNKRGVDQSLISQLIDTLDLCEMARYAPVSGISEQEVFEKAKVTIDGIEDKI